jgi:hypothetical protein
MVAPNRGDLHPDRCRRLIYQDLEDLVAACREGNPAIASLTARCLMAAILLATLIGIIWITGKAA